MTSHHLRLLCSQTRYHKLDAVRKQDSTDPARPVRCRSTQESARQVDSITRDSKLMSHAHVARKPRLLLSGGRRRLPQQASCPNAAPRPKTPWAELACRFCGVRHELVIDPLEAGGYLETETACGASCDRVPKRLAVDVRYIHMSMHLLARPASFLLVFTTSTISHTAAHSATSAHLTVPLARPRPGLSIYLIHLAQIIAVQYGQP